MPHSSCPQNCVFFRIHYVYAAKSLQLSLTLCNPIDGSPQGSAVPRILQARTLEWVAISFSNAWKWKVKVKFLSHVWLFATPWTAAHQAPLSLGFSRQEFWSGLPLPSPLWRQETCYDCYKKNNRYKIHKNRKQRNKTSVAQNIIYQKIKHNLLIHHQYQ